MNLNIDITNAWFYGGILNYKRNLSIQLSRMPQCHVVGCYNSRRECKEDLDWCKFPIRRSNIPNAMVYRHAYHIGYVMPISYERMMSSEADVNLFLTYNLPRVIYKKPTITTIHDIIPMMVFPSSLASRDYEDKLRFSIKNSRKIVTVSSKSKEDIIDFFRMNPDDVHIVRNAININEFIKNYSKEHIEAVKGQYHLPEKYILYFGGYAPHKNIERLLIAYAALSPCIRQEVKLVITNQSPILMKLANDLRIYNDVVFTPFIDEGDKSIVYREAEMLYYASLYEGFGVPILEAQICSIPVITSNRGGVYEASGGYAVHVDPYSVDDICQAIQMLLINKSYRDSIVANGYKNVSNYSWEKSAIELMDVVKNI